MRTHAPRMLARVCTRREVLHHDPRAKPRRLLRRRDTSASAARSPRGLHQITYTTAHGAHRHRVPDLLIELPGLRVACGSAHRARPNRAAAAGRPPTRPAPVTNHKVVIPAARVACSRTSFRWAATPASAAARPRPQSFIHTAMTHTCTHQHTRLTMPAHIRRNSEALNVPLCDFAVLAPLRRPRLARERRGAGREGIGLREGGGGTGGGRG